MLAPLIAEDTLNNKLSMHSVDDRIEGFDERSWQVEGKG